jgi:hypothetical protein
MVEVKVEKGRGAVVDTDRPLEVLAEGERSKLQTMICAGRWSFREYLRDVKGKQEAFISVRRIVAHG